LHSSESKAAGGPAESGRADVAAGSHQTSELVSNLGLSGLNLHRQEIYLEGIATRAGYFIRSLELNYVFCTKADA